MNAREREILADALRLRQSEQGTPLWFGAHDDDVLAVHALAEQGWLTRRWRRDLDDLTYRLSDSGLLTLSLPLLSMN